MMSPVSILHLSDLHFASNDAFLDDNKAHVPDALREKTHRHLQNMIRDYFTEVKIDAIAVSGDTTTRGIAGGFKTFQDDVGKYLAELTGNPRAVCIVPGNHDVKWGVDSNLSNYFDKKFFAYASLVRSLDATSSLLPAGTIPKGARGKLQYRNGINGPLYVDRNNKLIVMCINSAMRCGELDSASLQRVGVPLTTEIARLQRIVHSNKLSKRVRAGITEATDQLQKLQQEVKSAALFDIPHVTETQLLHLADLLTQEKKKVGGGDWENYFKVAVLHHHMVPFSMQKAEHKPFEIMADAARTLDMLARFDFHLILTGHKHHPYTQFAEFGGTKMLVAGGMTVGGVPAIGCRPGIRFVQAVSEQDTFVVKLAELFCDEIADPTTELKRALNEAQTFRFSKSSRATKQRQVFFPQTIEKAVENQLYERTFYKKDVVFDIEVNAARSGKILFTTTLSYDVFNIQDKPDFWHAEYNFDPKGGRMIEASIDGNPINTEELEFKRGRGISIPCPVKSRERAKIYMKVEETFADVGTNLFTSYFPAADLKVLLKTRLSRIRFDCEVLYAWKDWPVKKTSDGLVVSITQGLLPYQGVRLSWKPLEKQS